MNDSTSALRQHHTITTYTIVTSIFKESGSETLGTVLMRLMKSANDEKYDRTNIVWYNYHKVIYWLLGCQGRRNYEAV